MKNTYGDHIVEAAEKVAVELVGEKRTLVDIVGVQEAQGDVLAETRQVEQTRALDNLRPADANLAVVQVGVDVVQVDVGHVPVGQLADVAGAQLELVEDVAAGVAARVSSVERAVEVDEAHGGEEALLDAQAVPEHVGRLMRLECREIV